MSAIPNASVESDVTRFAVISTWNTCVVPSLNTFFGPRFFFVGLDFFGDFFLFFEPLGRPRFFLLGLFRFLDKNASNIDAILDKDIIGRANGCFFDFGFGLFNFRDNDSSIGGFMDVFDVDNGEPC